MPKFATTTQTAPAYQSEILVGDSYIVVDRPIDQSQTLVKGNIVVRDTTTGNWRINDGWVSDNPQTDTVGVILEDITTAAGEVVTMPVVVAGQIKAGEVSGLPTGYGAGSHLGLLILE